MLVQVPVSPAFQPLDQTLAFRRDSLVPQAKQTIHLGQQRQVVFSMVVGLANPVGKGVEIGKCTRGHIIECPVVLSLSTDDPTAGDTVLVEGAGRGA